MPLGCYQDEKITNLINLNVLGESLLALKVMHPSEANNISIVHDHIRKCENEFIGTLKSSNPDVTLSFADSKDELLIQYADNIASIYRKAFSKQPISSHRVVSGKKTASAFPVSWQSCYRRLLFLILNLLPQ